MSALLKCGVPGCRARIRGITGMREVENLQRHLNRVHRGIDQPGYYSLSDALEMRARYEAEQESANA